MIKKSSNNIIVLLDGIIILLISVSICIFSHNLPLMSILVAVIYSARIAVLFLLYSRYEINIMSEIIFLLICTIVGGFNDWNSVVNKKIYDYTVPVYFQDFSSIPIWMLVFWGLILRFIAGFSMWKKLSANISISDKLGIGKYYVNKGYVKVIFELLIIFATRMMVYSFYLDPVLSWLPFLIALLIYLTLSYPTRHDFILIGIFIIGGPLIEIIYINLGDLHYYHLGWIAGVPLWIALWWLIIILIFKDFSLRILAFLEKSFAQKPLKESV